MKCSQQKKNSQRKFKLFTAKCKYPQQTKTLTAKRKVHNKTTCSESPQQKRIMTLNIRTRQVQLCTNMNRIMISLEVTIWRSHWSFSAHGPTSRLGSRYLGLGQLGSGWRAFSVWRTSADVLLQLWYGCVRKFELLCQLWTR